MPPLADAHNDTESDAGRRTVGSKPRKVCVITVIPFQLNVFLAEHLLAMKEHGPVVLLTNGDRSDLRRDLHDGIIFHRVGITRPIRPWSDLRALVEIVRVLRIERPDIVQTLAPKAGLLGMLAACLCRVPVRVHWFTGQVWANAHGIRRWLLRQADRLISWLTTTPLADSDSQRDFLVKEGVADSSRLMVLGKGSVRGVDTARFRPAPALRETVRRELGMSNLETIAVFVGRVTRDKGLLELAEAMRNLRRELPLLHAVLVGFEEGGFGAEVLRAADSAADRVHLVGYSDAPERFLAAADFMVLPSYREGFGSSVIEAAACGIPTVGTRIVGLVDAIVEGETGLLVPARNAAELAAAMRSMTVDESMRRRLGAAAMRRAERDFDTRVLVASLQSLYGKLLRDAHASQASM